MIQFIDVTKRYGKTVALSGLTLTLPQGTVFGLLGPNGSGKSTLINLLMGFIFPDAGRIERGHLHPSNIGYVPERPFFPPRCPADEYLMTAGQLSNQSGTALRQAVAVRMNQVGLSQAARWRTNAYSKGMLQRLALAHALVGDPSLLILDEPMNGLDPIGQKETRDLIKTLHQEGKTILFSTHRLSDIADVCTHIGILKYGRLVREGSLAQVLPLRPEVHITVDQLTPQMRTTLTALHPGILIADKRVTLAGDAIAQKSTVLRRLLDNGVDILAVSHPRFSLEDLYQEALQS